MATAVLLMAGVMTVVTAPIASATGSTDTSLNLSSSSIKGVVLTSSTPTSCYDCALASSIRGMVNQVTVTLTPSAAASTSLSTVIVATDSNATVAVLKNADIMNVTDAMFNNSSNYNNSTTAIYDAEFIAVRVTASDTTTKSYYAFRISAASSDATLMRARFKGATAVLGTPNLVITNVVAGSVTITADSATVTNIPAVVMPNVSGFSPAQIKKFSSGANPDANAFLSASSYNMGALTDGDIIVIKNTAQNGSDYLYYKIVVTIGVAQQQNNNSSSSSDAAAIAAAAAQAAAAAVVAAKSTLVSTLKAGKPVTAADLSAADIAIASAKAADRVNAKILALPAEKRADLATLQTLVRTENFVDKVSTTATQMRVTTRDLVVEQLIPADYKYKASVIRAIIAENAASLDSIEKVEAVVKAAVAAIQARKDRLAATIAKINGTK